MGTVRTANKKKGRSRCHDVPGGSWGSEDLTLMTETGARSTAACKCEIWPLDGGANTLWNRSLFLRDAIRAVRFSTDVDVRSWSMKYGRTGVDRFTLTLSFSCQITKWAHDFAVPICYLLYYWIKWVPQMTRVQTTYLYTIFLIGK